MKTFSVLLLAATSSFFCGGLVGFVLAIPTAQVPKPGTSNALEYAPNTSLEEISKWLVTLIMGASLANAQYLRELLAAELSGIGRAFDPPIEAAVPSLLCTIGSISGFASAYYWTKTQFPYLMSLWDDRRRKALFQDFNRRNAQDTSFSGARIQSSWQVKANYLEEAGVSLDTLTEDPCKGKFGGKSKNAEFTISARVEASTTSTSFRRVEVTLTSETALPNRMAALFLHPTFSIDSLEFSFSDQVIMYRFDAWGSFTVGAIVKNPDGTYYPLEIDLGTAPGADPAFRSR